MEGRNDLPYNEGHPAAFTKKGHEEGGGEEDEADVKVGEGPFHNMPDGKNGYGIVRASCDAEHYRVGGRSRKSGNEHGKLRAQLHGLREKEGHGNYK